jgi:hypothetical protein
MERPPEECRGSKLRRAAPLCFQEFVRAGRNCLIHPVARLTFFCATETHALNLIPSQGYNLIHWSEAQMAFWAVSDLNAKELMEFVQDFATSKTVNPS